jgi:hypothetical protein
LNLARQDNRPSGTFMRAQKYDHMARSLEGQYAEGEPIPDDDYERLVGPLFESLVSADLLIDRGDIKGALRQIDIAEKEYASLCSHANVINDADAREFSDAARMISQKAISRSRLSAPAKASIELCQQPSKVREEKSLANHGNEDSR